MTKRKTQMPVIDWRVDVDFYSMEVRVRARTAGEAKRKIREKLKKGLAPKYVNHIYADKL